MELDPNADSWQLPIVGFEVIEIWFSGIVYVVAYGQGDPTRGIAAPNTKIGLGGAFVLRAADGVEHRLDGSEPWSTLTPLLSLRHSEICSACADRESVLRIEFSDGAVISAGPDPQYENWDLQGPDGLWLVAPPGGGDPRITH